MRFQFPQGVFVMGALNVRAVGEVHSDDDREFFTFVASGTFVVDGSELSCEVAGKWDERGLPVVSGDFKITNERGEELSAGFDGIKDYPGGGAVIDAHVLHGIHSTGAFAQFPARCACEIRYYEGRLEFSLS
jgi:hypothetical protein